MTTILSLTDDREGALVRARGAVRAGELIVAPTDTVYGLGADAFNREATRLIFEVKRRPRSLPLPVLVSRPKQAWALAAEVPEGTTDLVASFWPGALTLILPETELDWDLGDTGGGIALRMPDHPDLLELLERTGPLAMTSANLSGEPTPPHVAAIAEKLGEAVGLYLDGGPAREETGSTILDMRAPAPRVLRDGPVPVVEIEHVLGRPLARA